MQAVFVQPANQRVIARPAIEFVVMGTATEQVFVVAAIQKGGDMAEALFFRVVVSTVKARPSGMKGVGMEIPYSVSRLT
jgi:hypothetical protein